MYIYKITNLINNKAYIGQTVKSVKYRWSAHCSPSSRCTNLSRAIKKYGRVNFKIEVLEEVKSLTELNLREQFFIKEYNTLSPLGYNLTDGGDSNQGLSELTKKRMSESRKGEKHPMYGKSHSPESIKKMSDIKKGWPRAKDLYGKAVVATLKDGTEKIYSSAYVARIDGYSFGCISRCCKGERATHRKLKWRYLNG